MTLCESQTSIDGVSQTLTPSPSPSSEEKSLIPEDSDQITVPTGQKKKKKKKSKSAKARDAAAAAAKAKEELDASRPSVLCISRNKHWRYISSYHGPWLQLPFELLESLLILNSDPATFANLDQAPGQQLSPHTNSPPRHRDRGFHGLGDHTPPSSPHSIIASLPPPAPLPIPKAGKATPPPIDPGVFRSVTSIRKLIDEAAELSVRASSGLSSAALGLMGGQMGMGGRGNSPWAAAQSLGLNYGMGEGTGGGRNVAMSAMRVHRLRVLAVQKLAQAYKADEIASSVMVMQGGSVFDDVAERVLKSDPNDLDAKYVHFFHEKIPSRQLAESTTTQVLDELIAAQPQRLEYYRTRGIVHCFRDEYLQANKDFTYALKEARAVRKAKLSHHNNSSDSQDGRGKNSKKKKGASKTNGQAPPSGTAALDSAGEHDPPLVVHPSALSEAPDPIEPQLLFLRGASYLQQAIFLIEEAALALEEVSKAPTADGAELRLCYIENGRYGGVEVGNPHGPLGRSDGPKATAYKRVLGDPTFKERIYTLLRKSMRDHDKYLAHFDTLEGPEVHAFDGDLAERTAYAFVLSESIRPGNPPPPLEAPAMFTTYHPLLVESYFSILICQLMLADMPKLLSTFARTAALVDGLEGYPVFLPPRSMSQAEFIEVLERLAAGWQVGVQAHSMTKGVYGRLAIEAPPSPPMSTASDIDLMAASTSANVMDVAGGTTTPRTSTPSDSAGGVDLYESLDCMRMLLAPVVSRQKEKAQKAAAEKAAGLNKKKPLNINIPLHGPRVEIILAWLAAVHLGDMESVA
ncbi:hypothetical protein HWV62_38422 [Athelia sp. TMB]|nr:hypothetical protein HWV62_38422 [Athelia sp. TMB]